MRDFNRRPRELSDAGGLSGFCISPRSGALEQEAVAARQREEIRKLEQQFDQRLDWGKRQIRQVEQLLKQFEQRFEQRCVELSEQILQVVRQQQQQQVQLDEQQAQLEKRQAQLEKRQAQLDKQQAQLEEQHTQQQRQKTPWLSRLFRKFHCK